MSLPDNNNFDSFDFNEKDLPETPDRLGLPVPRGPVVPGGPATPGSPVAAAAAAAPSYPLDVSEEQEQPSPSRKDLESFYRELSTKPIKRKLFKRKREGESKNVGRKKKYTDNQIKKILIENNIYDRSSVSLDDGVHNPIVIIKERFGGNPYEYIKSLSPSEPENIYAGVFSDKGGKRRRKKRTKKKSRKKKRKTLKKKRKRRKKKRKTRR